MIVGETRMPSNLKLTTEARTRKIAVEYQRLCLVPVRFLALKESHFQCGLELDGERSSLTQVK
jgi:hypothetical protein